MLTFIILSLPLLSITSYALLAKPVEEDVIDDILPLMPECQVYNKSLYDPEACKVCNKETINEFVCDDCEQRFLKDTFPFPI